MIRIHQSIPRDDIGIIIPPLFTYPRHDVGGEKFILTLLWNHEYGSSLSIRRRADGI
jgi:hypothetical protein